MATESWPPNVAVAGARLRPLGAHVVAVADAPTLPFADASFDLVTSRHPVVVLWDEIARVLRPGGTYLSQQIGAGLQSGADRLLDGAAAREPESQPGAGPGGGDGGRARGRPTCEACALRVEFFDVAAVVHFLRKVPWTVPGFTPDAYGDRAAPSARGHRT